MYADTIIRRQEVDWDTFLFCVVVILLFFFTTFILPILLAGFVLHFFWGHLFPLMVYFVSGLVLALSRSANRFLKGEPWFWPGLFIFLGGPFGAWLTCLWG